MDVGRTELGFYAFRELTVFATSIRYTSAPHVLDNVAGSMGSLMHIPRTLPGREHNQSQGVVVAKVGLVAAPDRAELLPRTGHARLQVGRPEHRVRQQRAVPCGAAYAQPI